MHSADLRFTIVIITLVIMLLIAVVVITIFIANRRHVQREVQYERELRAAEQEVREQVLVNVARELHDNIGQLLTVLHMQLEQQKFINPAAVPVLAPMSETLSQTMMEVRRVGRSLNSELLDVNGLRNTIEYEVQRLRQLSGYTIHWIQDTEPVVLNKDQKVIVFRIFQEIINNTLKHSGATVINISLSGGNSFRLEVADNGKGFDLEGIMRSSAGSGLKNIISRARLAKLKCNIITANGKGTIFTLDQANQ